MLFADLKGRLARGAPVAPAVLAARHQVPVLAIGNASARRLSAPPGLASRWRSGEARGWGSTDAAQRAYTRRGCGKIAFEIPIHSGIMHDTDASIRASHNQVLHEWWQEYGWGLSIALTDTLWQRLFLP